MAYFADHLFSIVPMVMSGQRLIKISTGCGRDHSYMLVRVQEGQTLGEGDM